MLEIHFENLKLISRCFSFPLIPVRGEPDEPHELADLSFDKHRAGFIIPTQLNGNAIGGQRYHVLRQRAC